ncbi:MAG: AAA family ATPase [Candidatus Komeilibacteria bacterium]|nr:AAA family ATPase [Candidatus Komeilibacteria bacterium]
MRIFIFTGPSAVGKSTIAKRLAQGLHLPIIGEREIIHQLAQQNGFNRGREWLKAVGSAEPILKAVNQETINAIKNHGGISLIIDGSYDPELLKMIRAELPQAEIVIINVTADKTLREQRMGGRLGQELEAAKEELIWIDGWKKRIGLQQIIEQADITINNDVSLGEATQQIARELRLHLTKKETPQELRPFQPFKKIK